MRHVLFSLALVLVASLAHGQPITVPVTFVCDDAEAMLDELETKHGEEVVLTGTVPAAPGRDEMVMQFLARPGGGTWTVVLIGENDDQPSGLRSCIALVGDGWGLTTED